MENRNDLIDFFDLKKEILEISKRIKKNQKNKNIEQKIESLIQAWAQKVDENIRSQTVKKTHECLEKIKKASTAKSQYHFSDKFLEFVSGFMDNNSSRKITKEEIASFLAFIAVLYSVFSVDQEIPPKSGKRYETDVIKRKPLEQKFVLVIAIPVKFIGMKEALGSEMNNENLGEIIKIAEWFLYCSKKNWEDNILPSMEPKKSFEESEFDMFYLKIEMNEKDKRLDDKPSSLVVRDSLRDLAMKKAKLEFSERKPKESFIGKGFFRP